MSDVSTEQAKSDWIKAQILYLQGVPHVDIARQCNVSIHALRKRITRKEWTPIRATVIQQTETITRHATQEAANSVRPTLQRHLREIADSLPLQKKSGSMRHADAKSNVLLKLSQAAKIVEGWSETTERVVRLDLLSEADTALQPALPAPVIDVPTVSADQSEPASQA